MFHLKYPRRRGFFTWDELRCLARSLGFQAHVFEKYVAMREQLDTTKAVSSETILSWIEYNYFHKAFHQTFNHHTADWNECVLKNSIKMLYYHIASFEELLNMRIAYQVHEAGDMKGMILDNDTLLRAIKMCGRTIAPLKLQHRLKHMQDAFEEKGRIQLYEFLDLLLWCELYDAIIVDGQDLEGGKEDVDFYKLVDFEDLLTPFDVKLANQLNDKYLAEEWDFGKEIIVDRKLSRMDAPVKTESRKEQVKRQKDHYQHLKSQVSESQKSVYNAKAGYVRPRPISAPDLTMYEKPDPSMIVASRDVRPQSVYAHFDQLLKNRSAKESAGEPCLPPKKEFLRVENEVIVTSAHIKDTESTMESLKFENEVLPLKYQQQLDHDLEKMFPGHRQKLISPQIDRNEEGEIPQKQKPKKRSGRHKISRDEIDNKLSNPGLRGPPPTHAKTCDARFRGWHPAKMEKGNHFILTSVEFDKSPRGRLLKNLRNRSQAELANIRTDYVQINTKAKDVVRRKGSKDRPIVKRTMKQKIQDLNEERQREEEEIMQRETPVDESLHAASLPSGHADSKDESETFYESQRVEVDSPTSISSHLNMLNKDEYDIMNQQSEANIYLEPNEDLNVKEDDGITMTTAKSYYCSSQDCKRRTKLKQLKVGSDDQHQAMSGGGAVKAMSGGAVKAMSGGAVKAMSGGAVKAMSGGAVKAMSKGAVDLWSLHKKKSFDNLCKVDTKKLPLSNEKAFQNNDYKRLLKKYQKYMSS